MKGNDLQIRLANNLKMLRKEKGFTQFSLAEAADISEVTVRKIENCNQWPSENKLMQLADALEVDVCKFFLPVYNKDSFPDDIAESLKKALDENYKRFIADELSELIKN